MGGRTQETTNERRDRHERRWAGDILELLEERLGELDMDSPSDEALKRLMDRAEAGIASEVRHALRQDEGGE